MVKFSAEQLRGIMDKNHNIRNMSVFAHVDHEAVTSVDLSATKMPTTPPTTNSSVSPTSTELNGGKMSTLSPVTNSSSLVSATSIELNCVKTQTSSPAIDSSAPAATSNELNAVDMLTTATNFSKLNGTKMPTASPVTDSSLGSSECGPTCITTTTTSISAALSSSTATLSPSVLATASSQEAPTSDAATFTEVNGFKMPTASQETPISPSQETPTSPSPTQEAPNSDAATFTEMNGSKMPTASPLINTSSATAAATSCTVSASGLGSISRALGECLVGSTSHSDFVIPGKLTTLPVFHDVLYDFKEQLRSRTLKLLRELANSDNISVETGFEIADSVELLKVLNASEPLLETVGAKVRERATSVQEALLELTRAEISLVDVCTELSTYLQ